MDTNPPSQIMLQWKDTLGGFPLEIGLVTLDLLPHETADAKWVQMMAESLDLHKKMMDASDATALELRKAKGMVDKSVGDLKTMADDKIAMEDKLFLQFKEVLNSKKRKIALLRQELENLRAGEDEEDDDDASQVSRAVRPAAHSKNVISKERPSEGSQLSSLDAVSKGKKKGGHGRMLIDSDEEEEEEEEEAPPTSRKAAPSRTTQRSTQSAKNSAGGTQKSLRGTQPSQPAKRSQPPPQQEDDEDEDMSPGIL